MFSIEAIMSTNLITVSPSATLAEARTLMQDNRIHHIPVVEGDQLVGLITLTNVLAATDSFLRDDTSRIHANEIGIKDAMVTDVATVDINASLRHAALFLEKHKIGCLPVLDDAGQRLADDAWLLAVALAPPFYVLLAQQQAEAHAFLGGLVEGFERRRLVVILDAHALHRLMLHRVRLVVDQRLRHVDRVLLDEAGHDLLANVVLDLGLRLALHVLANFLLEALEPAFGDVETCSELVVELRQDFLVDLVDLDREVRTDHLAHPAPHAALFHHRYHGAGLAFHRFQGDRVPWHG